MNNTALTPKERFAGCFFGLAVYLQPRIVLGKLQAYPLHDWRGADGGMA